MSDLLQCYNDYYNRIKCASNRKEFDSATRDIEILLMELTEEGTKEAVTCFENLNKLLLEKSAEFDIETKVEKKTGFFSKLFKK